MVIFDEDNIYFETNLFKDIFKNKYEFSTVINTLRYFDDFNINDRNSNCYRFHVQNSNGEPYIGDFILSCDAFNKVDGVNEPVVIHCKTIKFIDTPLYKRFKAE